MTKRKLLPTSQVAKKLRKSISTVQRMAEDGRLPYVEKLPGRTGTYLFDADVVEWWARQNTPAEARSA